MRKFSWILCVVILSVLGSNASAKVKMLDVIHVTDGNMVTGEIVEIIPKETIKIKTIDSKLITYPFDQIEKMDQVEVKLKSRTVATALAAAFPIFPAGLLSFGIPVFSGWGQFYNGQPLKAVGFLANGYIGMLMLMGSETGTEGIISFGMVFGGYILSIVDANLSAKKINQKRLQQYQQREVSNSLNLNYIPHEGLLVSYHCRF